MKPFQPCRGRALAQALGSQSLQKDWVGAAPGWVYLGWGGLSCWLGFFTPFPAEASQEIFKIASMAPGALLLEAQKEYEVWHPALLHICLLPCAAPVQTQHYIHCDGKGDGLEVPAGARCWGAGSPRCPWVAGAPGARRSPWLRCPVSHSSPTGCASLQKESQKADEYLREIKDQKLLPEAVSQCIEAAGYEHEPETQKSLLRVSEVGEEALGEADAVPLPLEALPWPIHPPLAGSLLWEVLH